MGAWDQPPSPVWRAPRNLDAGSTSRDDLLLPGHFKKGRAISLERSRLRYFWSITRGSQGFSPRRAFKIAGTHYKARWLKFRSPLAFTPDTADQNKQLVLGKNHEWFDQPGRVLFNRLAILPGGLGETYRTFLRSTRGQVGNSGPSKKPKGPELPSAPGAEIPNRRHASPMN